MFRPETILDEVGFSRRCKKKTGSKMKAMKAGEKRIYFPERNQLLGGCGEMKRV